MPWRNSAAWNILINNAGASSFGGFGDLTDEQWVADINLKLFGFIRMTRAALPHLLKNGSGRIVNVAGNSGKQALEYHMPGAAANAAILNFSKSLSLQVGAQGVMINTVCPGPVRTARLVKQFAANAKDWGCTPEEAEERYLENLPLSYIPSARDIAYSVASRPCREPPISTGPQSPMTVESPVPSEHSDVRRPGWRASG